MAIRLTKQHDAMVGQMISGLDLNGSGVDTFLQSVKTFLDANFASFKDSSGNYTVPHIRQAVLTLRNRGK